MLPSPPARLSGVEALRGAAATAVILEHAARHVDKAYGAPGLITWFQPGHAGVDLFFVISGFIILFVHWPDIGRPGRLGHYTVRRFTRIMPLYWVALALTVAMAAAGHHGLPGPGALSASALLLPTTGEPLLGIAWTLQYELVFYVLFAALVASRTAGTIVLGIWLAVIVACILNGVPAGVPSALCGSFALEFFFGMAVAVLARCAAVPAPRRLAAVGAALFGALLVMEGAGWLPGFGTAARLAYGTSAALLLLGVAAAEQAGQSVRLTGLARLGGASYSIYLLQFVFIGVVWQALLALDVAPSLPHLALFSVLAAAALAGGLAASRMVEQPLLRAMRGRRPPPLPRPREA